MALLTGGLVLILPILFPNRTTIDASAVAQRQAIATAVEQVPYQIGRWVGTDIAVPPAAVELLRPNAILSRRYVRIDGGAGVSTLLVHCTDVRDMGGHYPPVCYPSTGWATRGNERGERRALEIHGRPIPVRMYTFSRIGPGMHEVAVRVYNVFVLPGGRLTPDIGRLRRAADRVALAAQGVAQLQIVTPLAMNEVEAVEAAEEIFGGMDELVKALGIYARN